MKKYMIALVFIFADADAEVFGQEMPAIQTDRPDQTECPFIVPAHHLQVENGFSYQREDEKAQSFYYPSSLFRYGVNSTFELRLVTELVQAKIFENTYGGITPLTVGFKVNLMQESGIVPTTSFIGHLSLPEAASEDFKLDYYAPAFRFTMQHTLSDRLSLSYNLGARWSGFGPEPIFLYTLTAGYGINEYFGCYAEVFGFGQQHSDDFHLLDAGITYLMKKNIQFDLSGGYQLTENAPDYYLAFGFSFRLPD